MHYIFIYGLALTLLAAGCAIPKNPASPATSPAVSPPVLKKVFDLEKLHAMDAAIEKAIAQSNCPGGVLWLEHRGVAYVKAYGNRATTPTPEPNAADTIYDAASLTKVMATTPAIMMLIEQGRVKLDAPAKTYLPEFDGQGRDKITVRHLLTHTSGLPPGLTSREKAENYASGIRHATGETLKTPPGTAFRYSDVNFILLGEIVHRVSGLPLNLFVSQYIHGPLGMKNTGYLPPPSQFARIAPTEPESRGGRMLRGIVHDPTARRMDRVAGHAGLFTTAADLARYCRMYLNQGALDGRRLFKPETVQLMTRPQNPPGVATQRGLGWDIDSPYAGPRGSHFPVGSFGHTGWTGTSVWMDPASQTFVIFLSNRNHPDGSGSVTGLRRELGTLAAEALLDAPYRNQAALTPSK